MQGISFRNFSCYYKEKKTYIPALHEISMEIYPGEFFVIVGASGSGKTTLLKSILGLCEYVEGALFVDGIAVDDFDAKKSNIGYVSQEIALYPNLTVYENIAFPLRRMYTQQEEVDRRVKEIADRLGIGWLLTRLPKHLSGGQHQRVAIARALVKNPQLLLMDEPFSNLEPALRENLCSAVKKIHQEYGNTAVYVTHDLEEACLLADRILVLEDGRAKALGTPEEMRCFLYENDKKSIACDKKTN